MPENPNPGTFVSEVAWIVGTVVVAYASIYVARKGFKVGRNSISALRGKKVSA